MRQSRSSLVPALIATVLSAMTGAPCGIMAQQTPPAGGLDVRVAPRDYLIAREARVVGLGYEGASPYYDLVFQTIYFINRSNGPLTLEGGTIELMAGGKLLQTTAIAAAELARTQASASAMVGMNFSVGLDVLYSASSILPPGIPIAPTLTLPPGTAGLVDDYYLIVRSLPDQARVTARARDGGGREITGVTTIPVRTYETRNSYILPLEPGEWYILAHPGLEGHHRWTAATEHGFDITMVDARGSWARGEIDAWRTGSVARWEDWYAYNKKVLAAAEGTVVKVVADVEFPLAFWNRGAGESLKAYRDRTEKKQMELFMAPGADPLAVAGGNHIVIRHAGGEYSFYGHLAYGSIRVREGQTVSQGEHIAGVGGTGEAPAVHLHFQLSDGASSATSRTLPVQFRNVRVNEQFVDTFAPKLVFQPGFFVTVNEPAR